MQVSNGSKDTFDLTVIIVAVADNGRATAIGYEHFPLKAGATNVQIPFGNTLPHGGYVIHADAIAEIPTRKPSFARDSKPLNLRRSRRVRSGFASLSRYASHLPSLCYPDYLEAVAPGVTWCVLQKDWTFCMELFLNLCWLSLLLPA